MKKAFKISFSLIFIALAFLVGFYLGFNKTPEINKVYGVENKENPEEISSVDFNDFWKAWNIINEKHPDGSNISSQEKVWGAISGLADSIGDPYTYFFNPDEAEDLNADLSGEFYGVGMEVGIRDGNLVVISPLKDSPSEKAGVRAGDTIVKIEDVIANRLTVDEAVDLIRGEKGEPVSITVSREGEEELVNISIIRDLVKIPVIETNLRDDGVFVIELFDFSRNSETEFEKALQKFVESGSKKLILDLRGNPGGYLSSAINISSWFLEEGKPIVIEKSPNPENNHTYRSNGNMLKGNFDLIVLVDEGSASASEIVAGALQEHGVAELLGKKTFGKGSVQELVHLSRGTELKITIAEWLTPNGISISENGLDPDYVVDFDVERYVEDDYDNQLEEAVTILLNK